MYEFIRKPKQFLLITLGFIFLCLGGLFTTTYAQNASSLPTSDALSNLTEYANNAYGTDNVVVNGRKYQPAHYNAKGDPYFLSDEWMEGSLMINGREFEKQELLYNIDIEKVILKTTINNSSKVYLVLNSEFIESFFLGPRLFVNASKLNLRKEFPGFVEQVYSGRFMVMTRYQKSFVSSYSKSAPNGFYSSTTSMNYIMQDGQLTKVPTKKSLFTYFSTQKKEIKNFMRKNKIKYKQADSSQLNKLFEYCDEISST